MHYDNQDFMCDELISDHNFISASDINERIKQLVPYPELRMLANPRLWMTKRMDLLKDHGEEEGGKVRGAEALGLTGMVGGGLLCLASPLLGLTAVTFGGLSFCTAVATDHRRTKLFKVFSLTAREVGEAIERKFHIDLPVNQEQDDGCYYTPEEAAYRFQERQVIEQQQAAKAKEEVRPMVKLDNQWKFLPPKESSEFQFVRLFIRELDIAMRDPKLTILGRFRLYLDVCHQDYVEERDTGYLPIIEKIANRFPVEQTIDVQAIEEGVLPVNITNRLNQEAQMTFRASPAMALPTQQPVETPVSFPKMSVPKEGVSDQLTQMDIEDIDLGTEECGFTAFKKMIYRCLFIGGGQRSGKTYLSANCCEIEAAEGHIVIYINFATTEVDVKSDKWAFVPSEHKIEVDLDDMDTEEARTWVARGCDLLNKAKKLVKLSSKTKRKILVVVDELGVIAAKSHTHGKEKVCDPFLELLAGMITKYSNTAIKSNIGLHLISAGISPQVWNDAIKNAIKTNCSLVISSINLGRSVVDPDTGEAVYTDYGVLGSLSRNFQGSYQDITPGLDSIYVILANKKWYKSGSPADLPKVPVKKNYQDAKVEEFPENFDKLIERLKSTIETDFWSFATNDLGLEDGAAIRTLINGIAIYLEENEKELGKRFCRTKEFKRWDARYSYPWYQEVKKEAIQRVRGVCPLCQEEEAKELHHLEYLGGEDSEDNVAAVCPGCHKEICHHPDNWIKGKYDDIWSYHSTENFSKVILRQAAEM
ncbi:MAG: HNH endonuclease [Moorea sp. SIO4A1]|uniref:HNH endonuclease signature motif containing protein n=1 Tax=Moorena sp. SIO4A1 TaxID=2607835 RepID=UPI001418A129|nr:HNH endonuclease signature motif containing protein [Moorena sp. SIO4A1]NEO43256.1 HNH endonuclease [Moorena sp. SIO4A3]NEQ59616.1 HNH endonuclease [Moorena sp. SIO4A1]